MRITEIAPPGREKQVKALKKKFDDKGAPYAIAWAQHNKHGKPKKKESVDPLRSDMDAKKELAQEIYNNNKEYQKMYPTWKEFMNSEDFDFENDRLRSKFEGKMSDIDIDIKTMSDAEFEKKYGKSKAQMQKDLNEAFNSERDEVKAILDKYGIKSSDDIELGSDVYDELFGYYMDSGEMPYGVMKARTGMPDEWIADRLDDLGLVENGPSDMGMNKYGLSATKFGDKFKSYQHGKLTGEFDTIEQLQKHQAELIQDKPVDEAPFGQAVKGALGRAVKRAGTSVKKAVGNVPGLGDLKTAAQGEQNIMKVADATWKSFVQFKQSNPTDDQMKQWFKARGMQIDSPDQANKNTVIQGVKAAVAQDAGGPAGDQAKPNAQSTNQEPEVEKVKTANLQRLSPEINDVPTAKRTIEKLAGGKTVSKKEIESILPLIKNMTKVIANTGKTAIVAKQMSNESLSQTDLSKLDMLARQGMVPKNKVARFKTAMRTLAKGKDLPISYKDDVIDVVMKLSKIITKPSVMGMIRKGLRENQDPKSTFDKWVKKAKDKHNI